MAEAVGSVYALSYLIITALIVKGQMHNLQSLTLVA